MCGAFGTFAHQAYTARLRGQLSSNVRPHTQSHSMPSILSAISRWLRTAAGRQVANTLGALDPEKFIYIKIPGNIQPFERGDLFEDRIEPVLQERGIGSVSGGGSSLGDVGPDGYNEVVFCGIDIAVVDREKTLMALRELLPTLSAPAGTEIHYTMDGDRRQDVLTLAGWLLHQPRDFLHPGFGV